MIKWYNWRRDIFFFSGMIIIFTMQWFMINNLHVYMIVPGFGHGAIYWNWR